MTTHQTTTAAPVPEVLTVRDPHGGASVQVFLDGHPVDPATANLDVFVHLDPDGGTETEVHRDGLPIETHSELVDAGYGWTSTEWNDGTREVARNNAYSDTFRLAVLTARADPPGAQHIT